MKRSTSKKRGAGAPLPIYSGAGNTFLISDERTSPCLPLQERIHITQQQQLDGVICLLPSHSAHLRMRIFNRDGSEAEMCGNGLRCLAQFLVDHENFSGCATVETMERHLQIFASPGSVATDMGEATEIQWDRSLNLEGHPLTLHTLNTGVPHGVVVVSQLEQLQVKEVGRKIRFHPDFAPSGINVNFVRELEKGKIACRTYERGVEDETGACGTGATAAALTIHYLKGWSWPIDVFVSSQERLTVHFQNGRCLLSGPAKQTGSFFPLESKKCSLSSTPFFSTPSLAEH